MMHTPSHHIPARNKGMTLLVATVIAGTLLLVATAVIDIAVKQSFLATAGENSQHAFYAADTGLDCALYWDLKNPDPNNGYAPRDYSAFATSAPASQTISCNNDGVNNPNPSQSTVGRGFATTTFKLTFMTNSQSTSYPCAEVTVVKESDGTTQIDSLGYNTCDPADPHRVERAIRAIH